MAQTGYCIRIQGHLASDWSEWFDGMTVQCQPDGTTILSGPVRDQAALHGMLLKVQGLGLSLVSVNPIELNRNESHPLTGQMLKADM